MKVLAICTDQSPMIAKSRNKHGLLGTFLADPKLEVTDQFGLRNMNTSVRPPGLPGLPIPTTLMLDAKGVVRWKDQSQDYMQRSNPEYVRQALTEHFQAN